MEMSDNNECILSCEPANPRRSPVSGLESVKYATEDPSGVGDQAPVTGNVTGNKKLVQQAFHPGLFLRPRSGSLGSIPMNINPQILTEKNTAKAVSNESQHAAKPPEWQTVPRNRIAKKRKISETVSPHSAATATSNRYDKLSIDAEGDIVQPKALNKPPPLILYGINDVTKLTETLESVLDPMDYNLKIVTKNQLRVNCKASEPYRKLMTLVREKGLIGHTFTRKEERCCRIVIRNLHHSTPHQVIKDEIAATGNKVVGEIINARIGPEKIPTSTFFVNLEPSPNNRKVKDIKYIYHTAVIIEDPKKRQVVPQCTRCQQYGHTKNNCSRPFRCVKCALNHKTSECPKKDRNTPAKCALCLGSHPANFKGCQVYREIHERKFNTRPKHQTPKLTTGKVQFTTPKSPNTDQNTLKTGQNTPQTTRNSDSYAEVTKRQHSQPSTCSKSIEELLFNQSEKIDALLQQISSMMSLIVKLVERLSP